MDMVQVLELARSLEELHAAGSVGASESLYVPDVTDWDAISKAYDLVKARVVNRVDGNGWKLYRVGETVRVDLDG
jgi:hypothetical protein